jgi:alpha-ketoglutaric semialdehyde dehydrogenase
MLTGKHLIAGEWVSGPSQFNSSPAIGEPLSFSNGSAALVERAAQAAESAFSVYGYGARQDRADFLNEIAIQLDKLGDEITEVGHGESGLPVARLEGERGRTTGQLRLFAEHIVSGKYLDRRATRALPDRKPLPRPDLKLMMRPVGPVVVFGASNFPLAFSTAGGDTASALAAGCPVIVKGHPAHPGTGELVAQAILAAARNTGTHEGVFSLIQDSGHDVARSLVQHPLVKAVGFTGSLAAGRSLFDLCAARPDPIPFFGELGSINPGFVLPGALHDRGSEIAAQWAASLTLGVGQFCTNPGVVFLPSGDAGDRFVDHAVASLEEVDAQTMLTDGIADAYRASVDRLGAISDITILVGEKTGERSARPYLIETTAEAWRAIPDLSEEVFGPLGIIVRTSDVNEYVDLAGSLDGQLTATLHIGGDDDELAATMLPVLERKAGRLLVNGFPTGVEVDDAMMHGGPYPASTIASATSVGTLAIRRFLRPVCYQGVPEHLLPSDLQEAASVVLDENDT